MKGKIFNAQEVQALLNGSKVMFREVIKPQPNSNINPVKLDYLQRTWQWATKESRRECPYQVGQKIFCKEKFFNWKDAFRKAEEALSSFPLGPCTIYKNQHYRDMIYNADNQDKENNYKWKPAQHMKQEYSRLTLLIKEIRVERLGEISEEDAKKEGFKNTFVGFQHPVYNPGRTANQDFEIFWNATHKKPEHKFEASPWVWVVEFEVINN